MKGTWNTGFKLALAALGVLLIATAIKSFVNYERSPGKDALFTVGTALVASVVGAKFLPGGVAPMLLTAGLVIGGYEFLKPEAEKIGNSIAASIRGKGGTINTQGGVQAEGKTYGPATGTPITGAQPMGQSTIPAQAAQPQSIVGQAAQPVTIIQQAAKGPSDFAYVAGKLFESAGSVFAGAGTKLIGSGADANDPFAKVSG